MRGELVDDCDAGPAARAAVRDGVPHHTCHRHQLPLATRQLPERPSGGGGGERLAPELAEQGGGLGREGNERRDVVGPRALTVRPSSPRKAAAETVSPRVWARFLSMDDLPDLKKGGGLALRLVHAQRCGRRLSRLGVTAQR
jgi:hypothetical protein